jgi:hypothetical protein
VRLQKWGEAVHYPGRDGHSGGVWKMFDMQGGRMGTFNADLTVRIGD